MTCNISDFSILSGGGVNNIEIENDNKNNDTLKQLTLVLISIILGQFYLLEEAKMINNASKKYDFYNNLFLHHLQEQLNTFLIFLLSILSFKYK